MMKILGLALSFLRLRRERAIPNMTLSVCVSTTGLIQTGKTVSSNGWKQYLCDQRRPTILFHELFKVEALL
jgi:hypothetical protein